MTNLVEVAIEVAEKPGAPDGTHVAILSRDGLASLHEAVAPALVSPEKKLEIGAAAYSDIHRTLDAIHDRADQLVRYYLLAIGAVVSVYLGAGGLIDAALLFLVPMIAIVGAIQIGLTLNVTGQFRRQQRAILSSLEQAAGTEGVDCPPGSLFWLSKAPVQRSLSDARCLGLAALGALSIVGVAALRTSAAVQTTLFSSEAVFQKLVAPADVLRDAIPGTAVFERETGVPETLLCTVGVDYKLSCQVRK